MTKVLVVMGGLSSERDISVMSGDGVATALREAGMDVIPYHLTTDIGGFVAVLTREKPDVVFNALHGRYGEDGCIQGLLEMMRIPYTHSGVLASAIGMDKAMTRRIARTMGIPVADGFVVSRSDFEAGHELPMPYVLKPNDDGSSFGVSIVRTTADREAALAVWPADKMMLTEAYIPGRELSVAVLGGQAIGIVEVIPKTGYYDFHNKYTAGCTEHIIPAAIPESVAVEARDYAERIHRVLGCRGTTRSDFRLDDVTDPNRPRLVFLEINTNPGMTPLSLVPDIARVCCGLSYRDVVVRLVSEAQCGK